MENERESPDYSDRPGEAGDVAARNTGSAGGDYSKGSAEDEATEAPTGKEALSEGDEGLPEDQTAIQADSS